MESMQQTEQEQIREALGALADAPPAFPPTTFPALSYELVPNLGWGHADAIIKGVNEIEAKRKEQGGVLDPVGDERTWEMLADALEALRAGPTAQGQDRLADLINELNGRHQDGGRGLLSHKWEAKLVRVPVKVKGHTLYQTKVMARPETPAASLLAAFALDILLNDRWAHIRRCQLASCRRWFVAKTQRRVYCDTPCRMLAFAKLSKDKKARDVRKQLGRRSKRRLQAVGR